MPTAKKRPTKADRAVRRLYAAVDKSIQAAEEVRQARDEIVRLATQDNSTKGPDDER
jgi:hypothetical protein